MTEPDQIIYSDRRSLALQINANAELIVRAPKGFSKERIARFIAEKEQWILRTRARTALRNAARPPLVFELGKSVPFMGQSFVLTQGTVDTIIFQDNKILIPNTQCSDIKKALVHIYKDSAQTILVDALNRTSKKIGIGYSFVKLSSARTRWGSCSTKQSVRLNWRLVLMPVYVIDYVCVHELCHVLHKNHGKQFWSTLKNFMPNYKLAEIYLKNHSFATTESF